MRFLLVVFISQAIIITTALGQASAHKEIWLSKLEPKSPNQTDDINALIYKPGRSKSFNWTGASGQPPNSWSPTGGSYMAYAPDGKLVQQTDTFFGSNYLTRNLFSYDNQNRQTERLSQFYDAQSQVWNNSYRSVTLFDAQGSRRENRDESWLNGSWVINYGYRDSIVYNQQNSLQEIIRKDWNSSVGSWLNDGRELWQYGPNNQPNEVLLQEWNGSAFVDSNRVINIVWDSWGGIFANSILLSYTFQKKVGPNWVDSERCTQTYGQNGSRIISFQVFENEQWKDDRRYSELFDSYGNQTLNCNEEFSLNQWDTTYCDKFLHLYDADGRILESVRQNYQNSINGFVNSSKQVFSQHQGYVSSAGLLAGSVDLLSIRPNPVAAGASFGLLANEGLLSIVDGLGRFVFAKSITAEERIPTSGYQPGLYQLIFKDRTGKISRGRLVVE